MAKSWRPKRWQNLYDKPDEYPLGMSAIDKAMAECFEAGADAMLEALRESAKQRIPIMLTTEPHKGFIIFIPDEENELQ